jgi:hypothetical protein
MFYQMNNGHAKYNVYNLDLVSFYRLELKNRKVEKEQKSQIFSFQPPL